MLSTLPNYLYIGKNKSHPYAFFLYLFYGILLTVILTFSLRLAFIFIASTQLSSLNSFEKIHALFWGWQFDLAAVSVPFLFLSLLSYSAVRLFKLKHLPLWPLAVILSSVFLIQISDTIYFLEAGRHSSYEVWALFSEASGLTNVAIRNHPLLVFIALFFTGFCFFIFWNKKIAIASGMNLEIALIIILFLCVYGIRGGFRDAPMKPIRIFQLANDSKAAIAENPVYSILHTLKTGEQLNPVYLGFPKLAERLQTETLQTFFAQNHTRLTAPDKPYNVILLALEAWPMWFMNDTNQALTITPEFNQFAQDYFSTDGLLAEGHRTAEGIFSLLCSYPNPLGNAIINNPLIQKNYRCLSRILTEHGWNTALFQGMHTGIVGDMTQKLGVTYSYGKLDIQSIQYPENGWGVDDHDLYNFVLEHAVKAEQQSPVFYVVNTMSTHDGTLPEAIPYIFGDKTRRDKIQSTLHYADSALGKFIKNLEQKIQRPTLLVITADHTRGPIPERFDNYHLPFAMRVIHGENFKHHVPRLASQRDIAPTILDWLGGEAPWFTGRSLWQLNPDDYRASYYSNGVFGWIEGDKLIEFALDNPEQMKCFQWLSAHAKIHETPCSDLDAARQTRARAYIHYSQTLLFEGKTIEFGDVQSFIENTKPSPNRF